MKTILVCALLSTTAVWADQAGDRDAIDRLIAKVNDPLQRPRLFAANADSDVDFDRLIDLHLACSPSPGSLIGMQEPWREMTVPRVVTLRVRFLTPDVVLVDAASTIRGAVTLAPSVPLLFVLKRQGSQWRIAAVRGCTTACGDGPLIL